MVLLSKTPWKWQSMGAHMFDAAFNTLFLSSSIWSALPDSVADDME